MAIFEVKVNKMVRNQLESRGKEGIGLSISCSRFPKKMLEIS